MPVSEQFTMNACGFTDSVPDSPGFRAKSQRRTQVRVTQVLLDSADDLSISTPSIVHPGSHYFLGRC
jgi:hypothetical protein